MIQLHHRFGALAIIGASAVLGSSLMFACSSSSSGTPATSNDGGATDSGAKTDGGGDGGFVGPQSKIEHVVVIVQENHTFDTYFGKYCTGATGSNPTCNTGPSCCEAGPATEPGGASPVVLSDAETANYDPTHLAACETSEMDNGKMDHYVTGASCSNAENFAYADPTGPIAPYISLVGTSALADHYFQPLIGQSSSNDMYLARAAYVFTDNAFVPAGAYGSSCSIGVPTSTFTDPTIGDLMNTAKVTWTWYSAGYADMIAANGKCPNPPAASLCPYQLSTYPCVYDPGDVPFQYYPSLQSNPAYFKDYTALATDLAGGTLPSVTYVKGFGYESEHPGYLDVLTPGVTFVTSTIQAVENSPYAATTLILFTYDEGGGYFDHIAPPADSKADGHSYGTRIPFIAAGPFAKKNYISHVQMEHSSIVKFIEWNWLGTTGQLGTRDAEVNNIGDMLDPAMTGTTVPSN